MRHTTPEAALTLLRESFEDLHLLLLDLVQLSRLPYATFHAVGKILYREVRRSDLVAMIIDKKFKPVHDRIRNPAVSRSSSARSRTRCERRQAAKVFLELFRLLHYLEFTDPDAAARGGPARHDPAVRPHHLRDAAAALLHRAAGAEGPGPRAARSTRSTTPSSTACPSSSRRCVNTELTDISVTRQAENVRTRVENTHGILKDCFQQSVVQLAQAFDPAIDGARIFPDFMAKREQSVRLRDGLVAVDPGGARVPGDARTRRPPTRMKERDLASSTTTTSST